MADGRYYWLKLKRDFFKRHDIRIVEEMPNGKEYILFYLKLLCESVDHDGGLRFSDEVPYNQQMLATVTNTNPDIVKSAVKLFVELHMMEVLNDGTIYMREVQHMIGSAADNDHAKRQARYRERQKELAITETSLESHASVTESDESKSKSKSKSKNINTVRFTPPSIAEVTAYCRERGSSVDPQVFIDFYESKGWMVGKNKMRDWKAALRTWERSNTRSAQGEPIQRVEAPAWLKTKKPDFSTLPGWDDIDVDEED